MNLESWLFLEAQKHVALILIGFNFGLIEQPQNASGWIRIKSQIYFEWLLIHN